MAYTRSTRYPELFRPAKSPYWWAFLPNPQGGPLLRETTKHRDEKAAHLWYLDKIRKPQAHPTKDQALADALDARIEWLRIGRLNEDPSRKKLALDTIEFYDKKGRQLTRVLGADTPISRIDHEAIRRYIVQRTKETSKASNIAKELTTLSCAMRLARKDGFECATFKDIVPDDFQALYVPKERWLTETEVDALLSVLAPKRAAIVAFIVATSATYPSEVAPIRRSHIKGQVVHLPGTKRGSRDRKLKVPSHAKYLFDFALKHLGPSGFEPWSNVRGDLHDAARLLSMCAPCRNARLKWARHEEGATKERVANCRACKATPRFEPLSPNDLRRTYAQWLVRSGVPYELVYPTMGHSSPKMLQTVYGKRDATAVADLMELALKKAPKGARSRKVG